MDLAVPPPPSERIAMVEHQLALEKAKRLKAEALLEERTRVLAQLNRDLQEREATLLDRLRLKTRLLLRAQRTAQIATLHETSNGELFSSSEFGHIVGLPLDERPSRDSVMRVVHPLDRGRVIRAHAYFVTDHPVGVDFTVTHRVIDAGGRIRWLRWIFRRTLRSPEDWSVEGTVQDITHQRASDRRAAALKLVAERQLRRMRRLAIEAKRAQRLRHRDAAFLEVVLNTVPQGIAVFSSDLRLALWNSRVPDLTEIDESDLVRAMPFDSFAALHWRHDAEARGDHLVRDANGRVVAQRFERTLSDGRVIEVEVRPLAEGGMVKTYADVSALKSIEEDLRAQGEELARRVAELEALSAELSESQREAEHANRSKSQFLAMMSHDIRTPLNGVVGMLSVLAASSLDDDQRRQVELARTAGEQLRVLLDDVVEIVRAESGKLDLAPAPITLRTTVEGIVEFWRATLTDQDLHIEYNIDPSLPERISVDPTRLRQLFDNLISNALKYTKVGRVGVRIDQRAEMLRVIVEDSGPGIAREQQAMLFTDFGRLRTTSPGDTPGAGLGLAICQRIVAAMGGEIGVESELGSGSCFWFKLPLVALPAASAELEPDTTVVVRTRDGRRPRVLIAEDVETNRVVLAMMLHLLGCEHHSVGNGEEAVEAVAAGSYDVVLMDVQMPRLTGIEATRAIRALPGPQRDIPIIGVTAHVLRSERAALLDAGMNVCISKPVQRPMLAAQMIQVLQGVENQPDTARAFDAEPLDGLLALLPPDRAAGIIELALADIATLRTQIAEAQTIGDGNAVKRARHSLAGVASNLGARGIVQYLTESEAIDLERIDRLVAEITTALAARLVTNVAA